MLHRKIKEVRCDEGGEFKPLIHFASGNEIKIQFTCPCTSDQNGRVERKHWHIVETGLSLLAQAHMPLAYWWEPFHTVVYLINRMPTVALHGKVPFTTLYNKEPDYHVLRTFGSACFPCLRPYQSNKFDFHTKKCVFLGYSGNHKGYRCLSPLGRTYTSKHVCFIEQDFLFSTNFLQNPSAINNESPPILSWLPILQSSTTFQHNTSDFSPTSHTELHSNSTSPCPTPSNHLTPYETISPSVSSSTSSHVPPSFTDHPTPVTPPPQPNTHPMVT